VAILGAGGTIAPAIVRDLAESDEADELLLLDIDEARAEAVADRHGGSKARAARADARVEPDADGSLASVLEGADVLVNSASYRVNLDAMAACLRSGCHYLDLGGLYWMTELQLELDERFQRDGLLALLGMGSAPGKTNLMAKMAVRALGGGTEHPPTADAGVSERDGQGFGRERTGAEHVGGIYVSAAGRDLDPPEGFSVPYALQTLLDELTMRPVVLRRGSPREIDPLEEGGVVDFGEPIGSAQTIHTIHSEMRTFGSSFGCSEASFRLGLSPELLATLRDLTAAPQDEVKRKAAEAVPPSPSTVSVHLVEASADGRGARVRAVTEPMEGWGIGGGIVSTATPAAAALRLLARGAIDARGVLPPEECVDPDALFAELEPRGCRVEVEAAEEAAAGGAQ
jgi:saccharopine dehydrogenase-like NADP-dependent oxidoreductase